MPNPENLLSTVHTQSSSVWYKSPSVDVPEAVPVEVPACFQHDADGLVPLVNLDGGVESNGAGCTTWCEKQGRKSKVPGGSSQ